MFYYCLRIYCEEKFIVFYFIVRAWCNFSEKGQLYTFGDGRHGKLALGQDSFSNQFTPLRVKRFSKFIVQKVSIKFLNVEEMLVI